MKRLYLALLVLLCFFLSPIFTKHIFASTIFQDNFDSYPNDSFPSRWIPFNFPPTCSAQWVVENGEVVMKIQNEPSCASNIIPKPSEWTTPLNKYEIELDMKFVNGTDHNLPYIIEPNSLTLYEVHFQSPGDFAIGGPIDQILVNVPQNYQNGSTYHVKIIVNVDDIKVFINNLLVREIYLSSPLPLGTIGLRAGVGGDSSSETHFDNIVVSTIDGNSVNLSVPLLKQTDNAWGGQLYDSANLWAPTLTPPQATDISRWGCALTSSVMLLRYYGITHLPDGTDLNPGTLNSWFETNSKSYIENGYVNWGAISKLSHLARSANPNFHYDLLEFDPLAAATNTQLTTDIQNHQPDILGVNNSGHFVITTGTTSATFSINDPFYNKTTLTDYGGVFSSIKHFAPANSDGSLIELYVNPSVNIFVTDQNFLPVGGVVMEQPLIDDPEGVASGDPVKIYYIKKPSSGKYYVTISSPTNQSYHLESDLFDNTAQDVTGDFFGNLINTNSDIYVINFNHNNSQNDSITKLITFNSLINDINTLCNNGSIDNSGICKDLLSKVQSASKDKTSQKNVLSALLNDLGAQRGKHVNESAYLILNTDIQALLSSF